MDLTKNINGAYNLNLHLKTALKGRVGVSSKGGRFIGLVYAIILTGLVLVLLGAPIVVLVKYGIMLRVMEGQPRVPLRVNLIDTSDDAAGFKIIADRDESVVIKFGRPGLATP